MKIPSNVLDYIRAEAEKIKYGRVILEVNETSNKIDIITENRERFQTQEPEKVRLAKTNESRNG